MKSQLLLLLSLFIPIVQLGCSSARMESPAADESVGFESSPPPSAGETMETGAGEWEELLSEDDALDQALQLSEVDCPSAHELVESICALAERVCAIAEDSADGETEERCVDGRSRCGRAQDRTSNICP